MIVIGKLLLCDITLALIAGLCPEALGFGDAGTLGVAEAAL
jgi:hypothetical protein